MGPQGTTGGPWTDRGLPLALPPIGGGGDSGASREGPAEARQQVHVDPASGPTTPQRLIPFQ